MEKKNEQEKIKKEGQQWVNIKDLYLTLLYAGL